MKDIYLDYAATTYVRPEVLAVMKPYFSERYANPSSFHAMGRQAHTAVEEARLAIKKLLHASAEDSIVFTGSGTESVNLAILGAARALKSKGKHIVTSTIEHKAVLETVKYLVEKEGFTASYASVGKNGIVNAADVEKVVRDDTILVSIMYANNEVGTIQPVKEISAFTLRRGVLFHTDACQAGGFLDLNVHNLGVDLMTLNASKIYGPKGVGLLYIKDVTKIQPVIFGGGQEEGLRSGTENVPVIIGFAEALKLACWEREKEKERLKALQDFLIRGILSVIRDCAVNGDLQSRLPNNVSVSFKGVDGEAMVMYLSQKGIYVSSGSACTTNVVKPSHVLIAIGITPEDAAGTIRFTIGKKTTKKDIERVLNVLPGMVESLRRVS